MIVSYDAAKGKDAFFVSTIIDGKFVIKMIEPIPTFNPLDVEIAFQHLFKIMMMDGKFD